MLYNVSSYTDFSPLPSYNEVRFIFIYLNTCFIILNNLYKHVIKKMSMCKMLKTLEHIYFFAKSAQFCLYFMFQGY